VQYGQNRPTFVQLIQQAAERWKKFRRALRREDHEPFDRLFVVCAYYTPGRYLSCHDNPMEAICYPTPRSGEKRLNAVEEKFCRTRGACEIAQGWILDLTRTSTG